MAAQNAISVSMGLRLRKQFNSTALVPGANSLLSLQSQRNLSDLRRQGGNMNLLRQIVIQAYLVDDVKLTFEVVDVMIFVEQNLIKQLTGSIVAGFDGRLDSRVEPCDRVHLQSKVAFDLSLD